MSELKILICGTAGAGKTTAIRAISEIAPVSTDVRNTDAAVDKALTTAGMDYGELTLDNGENCTCTARRARSASTSCGTSSRTARWR
nr:ATP/GTP-binding protein [Delftia sp. CH05]